MQDFAVDLLVYLDGITEGKREETELRAALVASGRRDPAPLFPEYFPKEPDEIEEDSGQDLAEAALDYSGVTFQSPAEVGEDERAMLAQIMGDTSMVPVSEEDFVGEVPPPLDPNTFISTSNEWT